MTAVYSTRTEDQIRAVDAVLVPRPDAAYLAALIDHLIAMGKRDGAVPSGRLIEIRTALNVAARGTTRDDASAKMPAAQPVIALSADAWIGVAEAADVLGITADAVRDHRRRGNLEGKQMGRQWLVTADSVEALKARLAEKRRSA